MRFPPRPGVPFSSGHRRAVRSLADNPTTPNQQGNDKGTQYRSSIFYSSDAQRAAAEASKAAYGAAIKAAGRGRAPVSTEILPAPRYWIAEANHQQYDARRVPP